MATRIVWTVEMAGEIDDEIEASERLSEMMDHFVMEASEKLRSITTYYSTS